MAHPGGRKLLNPRPAVDYAAILAETLAPLGAEAFPVATWTPQAIVSNFIIVKKFVAHVKPLTAEGDPAILTAIIGKGSTMEFWSSPETCTAGQMYKFCSWLKSGEGTQFMNDTRRKRALERKCLVKGLSFQEASFVSAMEAQVSEFSMASKKARDEMEEALARLRWEIVQVQERMQRQVWVADKVVQLGEAGDRKKANRFRNYIEAMGGEVSAQVRNEVEERAFAAGGGGRNLRRVREGLDAVDTLDQPCRRRRELEDAGNQEQATAEGEGRNAGPGPAAQQPG